MKDCEVWADLAENLKGAGRGCTYGLCRALERLYIADVIGLRQRYRMRRTLQRIYDPNREKVFYWPKSHIAPRVRACRHLAYLTEHNRH